MNEPNSENKNKPFKDPKGKKPPFNMLWVYGLIALAFFGIQFINFDSTDSSLKWADFELMLKNKEVSRVVVVNKEHVEVFLRKNETDNSGGGLFTPTAKGPEYSFNIGTVELFVADVMAAQKDIPKQQQVIVEYEMRENVMDGLLGWILPLLLIVAFWIFIIRRMSGGAGGPGSQIFSIGKSKAKIFNQHEAKIKINFKDVAGLEEAKVEITEIVDFLKNPAKYTELGGKIPKGALLVGPPGTGKTLLAKAVAGEAGVPFFSMSGSDFVEMFVGVGASRVRDLFKQAKDKAPCIIFIDEIDAIGRARGKNPNMGSNDERENTLNQLLTEMDGFDTNTGVIVLAATNRADILDKALMRAGRFDRQIHVELPDLNEREAIFKVHLKPLKKLSDNVDPAFLAKQTPGFSGADIANVCNEAALIAARGEKKEVEKQDFLDAVDRIVGGLEKRNKLITNEEKKTIAYHEAGHATLSWMLEHAHPLIKVTIVPRGKALGAAWYLPGERHLTTKEQFLDEIIATLGGRAAEEIFFSKITSGALNDLETVTKKAYALVSYYGMSDKVGHISFFDSSGQSDYSFSKPYSERTAELIDQEVNAIIATCYQKAIDILNENKEGVVQLGEKLLEKEVVFSSDLEEIFGKRKFGNENEDHIR